jgi:hypothetical protein
MAWQAEDRDQMKLAPGASMHRRVGSLFKKDDVSEDEPGKPDQEHNEKRCAEHCRSDTENQGVGNAFHQLVDADSTGSATAKRGVNGPSRVLPDFEFLKLSRERILAGDTLGCRCCIR